MEDIIDIIVTETTNLIEITSQPTDEIIDVNIIDNREDVTLNVTPTLVEININSLTGNFGILWGEIEGTLSNQTDLQNALNLKADLVDGKVPSSQLPSYVDDVVEVANYAALPVTGEVGKIYITLDTNFIYRWTGSTYVEIKDSSAVWGAITGTLSNQTDLQSALNAKQDDLNGTGFVKASGTTITYDNTSYLPLTGGTLTGNLLGTNITISNSLIAKGGTFNGGALSGGVVTIDGLGSDLLMNRADTSNGASITFLTNAVEKWNIGLRSAGTTDNFFIYNSNLTANALTINSATSAATFASSATATNFILSGGTGNTGLYYGHTDRVVLANYTTGGIDFEVNGGSIVATLFPSGNYGLGVALDAGYKLDVNGTARISGALSGTSATFSGNVISSGIIGANAGYFRIANNAGSVPYGYFLTTSQWTGVGTDNTPTIATETGYGFRIYTNGGSTNGLTIASTGAATFSSSVTVASTMQANYVNIQAGGNAEVANINSTNANGGYLTWQTSGSVIADIGTLQQIFGSGGSTNFGINARGAKDLAFGTNNTERLRITSSGNVGIGLTSPSELLTAAGNIFVNGGNGQGFKLNGGLAIYRLAGDDLGLYTASSERMRITSGGVVAIGTTSNVAQTGETLLVAGDNGVNTVVVRRTGASNTNASRILFQAINASSVVQNTGIIEAGLENSSTAGYLAFFSSTTERMRITSSGNVGIGTTSPTVAAGMGLVINGGATSPRIALKNNASGDASTDGFQLVLTTENEAVLENRENASMRFLTNATEAMRITSSGNVGIGTTSPTSLFHIASTTTLRSRLYTSSGASFMDIENAGNSFYIGVDDSTGSTFGGSAYARTFYGTAAYPMAFWTNGSERMRITSSGTLCVGRTTSPSSAYTAAFQEAIAMYINTNGNNMINWFNASGTYISSIVINSASVNYNTSSDYRLKTDLKAFSGLDIVSKINVYDFAWKSDNSRTHGVIAHELQEVLPSAVSGIKDAIDEDGNIKNQGVDYSKIVPVMVQAIKELKVEVDTLKNK